MILFADGDTLENGPKRLVLPDRPMKVETARWLGQVRASGQTDPLPAIKRAFAVLKNADAGYKGKLIYLLTDSLFPDTDAVIKTIADLNADKSVQINTYLYGDKSADAEKVMQKIAADNGGKYKYIRHEDD